MRKVLIALSIVFSLNAQAEENSEEDMSGVVEMLVVAKATGMCGVFSQLINFQQTTRMEGGDEFIIRFLSTEAARLGQSVEEFTGRCPDLVRKYNSYMTLLGFDQ